MAVRNRKNNTGALLSFLHQSDKHNWTYPENGAEAYEKCCSCLSETLAAYLGLRFRPRSHHPPDHWPSWYIQIQILGITMENLENLLSLPGSWALPCLDIISYVAIAAFWHGHLTQDIQGNWRCQGRHLVMDHETFRDAVGGRRASCRSTKVAAGIPTMEGMTTTSTRGGIGVVTKTTCGLPRDITSKATDSLRSRPDLLTGQSPPDHGRSDSSVRAAQGRHGANRAWRFSWIRARRAGHQNAETHRRRVGNA